MKSVMLQALRQKPECFAMPSHFHMLRPGCEKCTYGDLCGATVTALVGAIESQILIRNKVLVSRLSSYRTSLTYWDNLTKQAPVLLDEADMASLLSRALEGQARKNLAECAEFITCDVASAELGTKIEVKAKSVAHATESGEDKKDSRATMLIGASDIASLTLLPNDLRSTLAASKMGATEAGSSVKPSAMPLLATTISLSRLGAASGTSPHSYAFPMPTTRLYETWTNKELSIKLAVLLREGVSSSKATGYESIRSALCAIHIEMNYRKQHAPRFRPLHTLTYKSSDAQVITASCDRQVIDIHWRAHSPEKPPGQPNNYSSIFADNPFDLDAAEQFAREVWTMGAKVVHLHLPEDMQWEHAILQSPAIREKWKMIEHGDVRGPKVKQAGMPHIASRLYDAMTCAGKRQGIIFIPAMVNAWASRRIVGENIAGIVRMIAFMTGEKPRDPSAVRKTLTALDGHLRSVARIPMRS